ETTSDDTFVLTVSAPSIANGCADGRYEILIDGVLQGTFSGNANVSLTVAADGATHTLTYRDACEDGCAVSITYTALSCPYDPPCTLSPGSIVDQGDCNNQGTPATEDDTYILTLTPPTVNNGCGQFVVLLDGTQVGGPRNFSNNFSIEVPADGATHMVMFRDACEAACAASIEVPAVDPCPEPCAIEGMLMRTECIDENNFTVTFRVNTTGDCNSVGWFATDSEGGVFNGFYNTEVTRTYSTTANDPLVINFTDIDDSSLTTSITVAVPDCDGDGLQVACPRANHFCPILEEDIMLYTTDPFECTAQVLVSVPDVTGACEQGFFTYTVALVDLNGNVLEMITSDDPQVFERVALGDYFLRYVVTDDCGNTAIRDCRIRVADIDEPVAVCNDRLNVSLGGHGLARVYWHSIDNGSYDNCGIDTIEVRRRYDIHPGTCDSLSAEDRYFSSWGPYVQFNCCEVNTFVTVEMRVTDVNGNVNYCWMQVLVEDKTLPYCTGLEDQIAECDELPEDFDPTNTTQLAELFGTPNVVDNCSAEAEEQEPEVNLDEQGNGTITRRFLAIDAAGNVSMTAFEQIITIVGCTDDDRPTDPTVPFDPRDHSLPVDDAVLPLLGQNIPNPAFDETVIPFFVPEAGDVAIEIFDVRGSRQLLLQDYYEAGHHKVRVDVSTYQGGMYFYKLRTGKTQLTRKMMVTPQ
ncbi:MAG: T9SS C-terminal target domain-containing protein, partial [Bacteroidetes bacterium]